ncbi:integrase core domain-containing protein [Humisphaera borealis]|uniref:DDE-type integrase/transposase/recombinase n=1 Tax=Humisphaera borealis TaxID=2807512 RepID=A0A7M2X4Y7_9BACT|nr:integrase core domain-containing protein [Humisphaera borealis]QOV92111.1 DDE-type integrase/transposase/recombinase [Humisphaera borealis]
MAFSLPRLLRVLCCGPDSDLVRRLEFVVYQNQLYRDHHGPLRLTGEEKRKLVDLGTAIGAGVALLLSIVGYSTFRRWVRAFANLAAVVKSIRRSVGRPKTANELRELGLRLARENAWGYTRILGELAKFGVTTSRSNIVNILRDAGVNPQPRRGVQSWSELITAQAETLWQCDFFSRHIVTLTGIRQCFVLVFLHVASRRVYLSPCAFNPTAEWMKAQAEAFIAHAKSVNLPASHLIRDNDGIFTKPFDETLTAAGCEVKRTAVRAPNMNAFVERFHRSIQEECLDRFLIFGQEHFDLLVREYVEHYHEERPHQGKENQLLITPSDLPPTSGKIHCRRRLGGVLKHYNRAAA